METLRELMKSYDNVKSVQAELCQFINCYGEALEIHQTIINMDLPEEEVLRQNTYVNAIMTKFLHFTDDVKVWLSEAGYPYLENNDVDKVEENYCVVHNDDDDEMNNNEADNGNVNVNDDEIRQSDVIDDTRKSIKCLPMCRHHPRHLPG